jgi:hypothetical protein
MPAGRYDFPIPTRFLAPVDCLKIAALNARLYNYMYYEGNIEERRVTVKSSSNILSSCGIVHGDQNTCREAECFAQANTISYHPPPPHTPQECGRTG